MQLYSNRRAPLLTKLLFTSEAARLRGRRRRWLSINRRLAKRPLIFKRRLSKQLSRVSRVRRQTQKTARHRRFLASLYTSLRNTYIYIHTTLRSKPKVTYYNRYLTLFRLQRSTQLTVANDGKPNWRRLFLASSIPLSHWAIIHRVRLCVRTRTHQVTEKGRLYMCARTPMEQPV